MAKPVLQQKERSSMSNSGNDSFEKLEKEYADLRAEVLEPLAEKLHAHIASILEKQPRIDRISTRAKSVERFIAKAQKADDSGALKYQDPLEQIQDLIGARVVVFYLRDVELIRNAVLKYLPEIEEQSLVPESEAEFGYFGKHFILFVPNDVFDGTIEKDRAPKFFELQIKTLFQHAWAEANHDLQYKPTLGELSPSQRRKVAFTSAQAWGADTIFDELLNEFES